MVCWSRNEMNLWMYGQFPVTFRILRRRRRDEKGKCSYGSWGWVGVHPVRSAQLGQNLLSSVPFRQHYTHTLITLWGGLLAGKCKWPPEWPHPLSTLNWRRRRRRRTIESSGLNRWKTNNRTLGSKWRVMFNLGPHRFASGQPNRMMSIRFRPEQLSFTLPIGHYLDKKCQSVKPTNQRVSFVWHERVVK